MYHRDVEELSGANPAPSGRILALDFGLARIGLAVSDALGLTAQGLPTLERTNKRADLERIGQIAAGYPVTRVLVGHPVSRSGEETEMSRRAERFAEDLRERLGVPVELWDERMTSQEADRALREAGMDARRRRQTRDRVAAQILLQSYLDRQAFERLRMGARAAL